jgi:hypothetical protein
MKPEAEKLDWRLIVNEDSVKDSPEIVKVLDDYFSCFAKPKTKEDREEFLCLKCDRPLTGFRSLLGDCGFRWGLVHGEGFCQNCHWPARAHHYLKKEDGTEIGSITNLVLQYHPDYVIERKTEASQEETDE